ncbi:MAG: adenylyltransferase/cytidyltransferase family protein [Chitinophagaceae bacterium]
MKIVVVSGGFDPIHSGHIALLREASLLGDLLVVGVNSDEWLTRKKGKPFMPREERETILRSIQWVDSVWNFDDSDGTACVLLNHVRAYYSINQDEEHEFIFANGGDRNETNNAEANVPGWQFVYGVGGSDKKNSSSWLLEKWNG